jgi:hypothetical protein
MVAVAVEKSFAKRLLDTSEAIVSSIFNDATIIAFERVPVLKQLTDILYTGYEGGPISDVGEIIYAKNKGGYDVIGYRSFKRRLGQEPLKSVDEIIFDHRGNIVGYKSGEPTKPEWDDAFLRSGALNALFNHELFIVREGKTTKRVQEPQRIYRVLMDDVLKYIKEHKLEREIAYGRKKPLGVDSFGRTIYSVVLNTAEGIGKYEFGRYLDPHGYDPDIMWHYLKQRMLYGLISTIYKPIEKALEALGIPLDSLFIEKYKLVSGLE